MPVKMEPDPRLQNNLLAFGWECDKGWYPLIQELIDKLNEFPEDIYVTQIKEKFGGLRFYIGGGTDKVYDLIHEYEEKSYKICEVCGKPGKTRERHGWYKTVCRKCLASF